MQYFDFLACSRLMCFRVFVFVTRLAEASKTQSLKASNLQVASAGDAKRKQSAARRARQACYITGRRPFSCGKPCRRPDMLVMSLSPLLGHAIPELDETTEILVFPRRGSHFQGPRVSKPQEQNKSPYPPRIPGGGPGGGLWAPGGAFGRNFGPLWPSKASQMDRLSNSGTPLG